MLEQAYTLHTIGYASKPIRQFIQQLQRHKIDVVADIRSVPYSKVFHDYHRESIAAHLQQNGLRYVYLGDELGPRSKNPLHYDDSGQVQFDRLMHCALFARGIERLYKGIMRGYAIALMCAEKDPVTCHRSLLVGYFLVRNSQGCIMHIQHDGSTETQQALEQRIVEIQGIHTDLFLSSQERRQLAYSMQLKNTSYRKKNSE